MIRITNYIVIIAEIKGDIQYVVDEINKMFRPLKIKIKSLVCARDCLIKADVYINDQKLNQVHAMVYE